MVMEKLWNMKNWPKVIEFCDSVMEFYQFCPPFVLHLYFFTSTKLGRDRVGPHFHANSKAGREMENLEMVMEKSWKNILSSLWEP